MVKGVDNDADEKKIMMMAMEKKDEEEEDDVFSKLPHDVIIHILSFLDTPTAAKTSILCKRFTPLWLSLPSLVLPEHSPPNCSLNDVEYLVFVSDLIRTVSKRNNTSLHKLCLSFNPHYMSNDEREVTLPKLLRRAFKLCSGELELSFNYTLYDPALDTLLSSAPKSLTSMKFIKCTFLNLTDLVSSCPLLHELSLVQCVLETPEVRISGTQLRVFIFDLCYVLFPLKAPIQIEVEAKSLQTFIMADNNGSISKIVFTESLDSLKILTLKGYIMKPWLEDTIPKFLALESLIIDSRESPNYSIKISSQSLKSLDLRSHWNVTIDSPRLTSVSFGSDPCSIGSSTHGFRSITSLVLHDIGCFEGFHVYDDPEWLEAHLSRCKQLRKLKLISCVTNEKIHISHKKLEILDIWDCLYMVEAHIDTPRLRSFTHRGEPLALKHFNHSTSLEVALHIKNQDGHKTTLSLSRMSPYFLQPYKSCKILTMEAAAIEGSITQHYHKLFDAEVLVLRVGHPTNYKRLIESLLWMCCHLKLIKIISESQVKSIEFKYRKVTSTKFHHYACLKSRRVIRCWTHRLERVMLTNISSEQLHLQQFFKNNCKMVDVNIQIN